jgi:NAD(P)-dependent dehydrogenase (short-subunit alcohol dehydrogenase family)
MPVAVITRGASWFSREIARQLLGEGWTLALSDIDGDELAVTVAGVGEKLRFGAASST